MIKEAYCSFEVAKLLKEKGFREATYHDYDTDGIRWFNGFLVHHNQQGGIACPTQQMTMKWLREEHNIFINIDVIPYTTVTMEQRYYFYKIYRNRRPINFPRRIEDIQFYDTPEEAIEAGIKFSLENLI